jgi:hypothetical protein
MFPFSAPLLHRAIFSSLSAGLDPSPGPGTSTTCGQTYFCDILADFQVLPTLVPWTALVKTFPRLCLAFLSYVPQAVAWSECFWSSPIYILKPNPPSKVIGLRGMAFGKWLGYERRALVNGMSAFITRGLEQPLSLLPCEGTARRYHLWESGPYTHYQHIDLRLSNLQNCEK